MLFPKVLVYVNVYQNYCQKRFKFSQLVIKEIISSIDEEENEMKFCSEELNITCDKVINEKIFQKIARNIVQKIVFNSIFNCLILCFHKMKKKPKIH
jgi:hypothetical protein